MRVEQVVQTLDGLVPFRHAEEWDNVGLLLGDPRAEVTGVLLTIDLTPAVIDEAKALGADVVVAYHPPLFRPQKTLLGDDLAYLAVRAGLHVVSPHTAFDAVVGGTNDVMMERLGIASREPLIEREPNVGAGRIGLLPDAVDPEALVQHVKSAFEVASVLIAGARTAPLRRVAVCAGSGGGLLGRALARGAEAFVTGELSHHDALRIERAGMVAVMLRHSVSERLALPPLAKNLAASVPVPVHVSREDRDPLRFA